MVPGARPGWSPSLPALLDVALDELLGVLLQHGVDLVEDVVHLLLELLALGGGLRLFGVRALLGLTLLGLLPFLLLWHFPLLRSPCASLNSSLGRRLRPLKALLSDPELIDQQPVLGTVLVVRRAAGEEIDPGGVEQRNPRGPQDDRAVH